MNKTAFILTLQLISAVLLLFFWALCVSHGFLSFVSIPLPPLCLHISVLMCTKPMCVCVSKRMVLSIWASLVSADVFWRTFFPFKEHKRYYSTSNLWSFSGQEKATELLGEDGQSRWITTVCDCESADESEELISPPPPPSPPALCPQINPWTWSKETRSPSWSHSLWSQPSPSKSADSRQPPPPRQ